MDNPFALLDLEPRFDLDADVLQDRFLAESARCHPDRFADPLEQADAADRMSRVTEAYRVLGDPESRANALLALRGGPGKSDDKSLPPAMLMEMMEVRESMEEAVAGNDAPAIEKHRAWAADKRGEHLTAIGKLFEQAPGDTNAAAIRLQLNGLRYIERMLEQLPVRDADDAV